MLTALESDHEETAVPALRLAYKTSLQNYLSGKKL